MAPLWRKFKCRNRLAYRLVRYRVIAPTTHQLPMAFVSWRGTVRDLKWKNRRHRQLTQAVKQHLQMVIYSLPCPMVVRFMTTFRFSLVIIGFLVFSVAGISGGSTSCPGRPDCGGPVEFD